MSVEYRSKIIREGEMASFYCRTCQQELSRSFYTRGGQYLFLSVHDCEHYQWIFVGDPFLDPPWDEEVRELIGNAIAKVNGNGGKYFLLPLES